MGIMTAWRNLKIHQQVFALTIPMVLSNISVPLVGTVDTMVMGRLPEAHNMAAVGLGSALYLFLVGCLNFLRMGTTGFASQAKGEENGAKVRQILLQAILLSFGLAIVVALIALPFSEWALNLLQTKENVASGGAISDAAHSNEAFVEGARTFFSWRLWGLPAALLNYTLVGWFLGLQNARIPLLIMLVTNVVNMALSVLFVLYLHKGVVGAAQAAIIAEWSGAIVGLWALKFPLKKMVGAWDFSGLKRLSEWKPLLFVNRDIFFRSLILQIAFLLVSIRGGRLGEETVAANMIILNGLLIISYLLDGFAHAIESLCGHAIGAKSRTKLRDTLIVAGGWGLIVSLIFAVGFVFLGKGFINLLTHIESVREAAYPLIPYLTMLPLIGVWSYLFDGLFIGATRAKEMRDSMFVAFAFALMLGAILYPFGNHGLWIAFLSFMALRGGLLGWIAYRIDQRDEWIAG